MAAPAPGDEKPSALPELPPLLEGRSFSLAGEGVALDYAATLLGSLGAVTRREPGLTALHPSLEWARSGAMALTGWPDGPPLDAPAPLASCARGAGEALRTLAGRRWRQPLDAPALLGERAALLGLARRGTVSPGGSCRLLPASDGWIALNLARAEDRASLPAWLGEGDASDPWRIVAEAVARGRAEELVVRARLLGLPAAVAEAPPAERTPWLRVAARGRPAPRPPESPLVIDLSSLWAGPLCAHLLGLAGARVVKLESTRRPDGARRGPRDFYDLLNAGKASVALDFRDAAARERLRALLLRADIVVESARPRALRQLGLDAERIVAERPGLTWLSITGYGRRPPGADWVAFGDDAAVAAGLARAMAEAGDGRTPLFCGDAIADPLTGLHAALAALAGFSAGGGWLLDLCLRDVTAHALGFETRRPRPAIRPTAGGFEVRVAGLREAVAAPRARRPAGRARPLGADNSDWLAPC